MNPKSKIRNPKLLLSVSSVSLWFVLFLATLAQAATRTYDAEAAPVVQIDKITVAGTWAAADTGSIVIGNSTLTFTCGSDTTTTAQVATVIKNAINAPTIDASLVGKETRSAAGQQLGEFRDVEATIDPADTAIVRVRSRSAGVPFYAVGSSTLTVSESTAGTGTLTAASVQAATGPWHWDNATNWSANTLPVNDDTAEFKNTANGPKYGLPNGALEVTIEQHNSFTGPIGLQPINALGYSEYRQQWARLNDAGTGTNIAHRYGLGTGPGSPWIAVRHTLVKCTPVVYGTGQPAANSKALNIVCSEATSELTVIKGSVDASTQDGTTAGWAALRCGSLGGGPQDSDVRYTGPATTFYVMGGKAVIESIASGSPNLWTYGGVTRVTNCSATWPVVNMFGGTIEWVSTGTLSQLQQRGGSVFDASFDRRALTITAHDFFGPAVFRRPQGALTWGDVTLSGVLIGDGPDSVRLVVPVSTTLNFADM